VPVAGKTPLLHRARAVAARRDCPRKLTDSNRRGFLGWLRPADAEFSAPLLQSALARKSKLVAKRTVTTINEVSFIWA
jgi:hypothetical protein